MAKRYRIYEDPRSDMIAVNFAADAMGEITQNRIHLGADHYQERDRVLRELAPAWVKLAGKDAADKAVRILHVLSPDRFLTAPELARERWTRQTLAQWDRDQHARNARKKAAADEEFQSYQERHGLSPSTVSRRLSPPVFAGRLLVLIVAISAFISGALL